MESKNEETPKSDALKFIIEAITNKVLASKSGERIVAMTYIDVVTVSCNIVEQVANKIKQTRDLKNLTGRGKLELACDIIEIVVNRLKDVQVPGMNRNILLSEDVDFIFKLTNDETQKTINGVIATIKSADRFGDLSFLHKVAQAGWSCFKFGKKKFSRGEIE